MTEIKYTTDGKKVVVIGNLNSQEKIVQEIFVSGESEIPAGEHFVVKSLLDAPAVSWKEKKLKEIEERYDKDLKKIEKDSDDLWKKFNMISATLKAKMSSLIQIEKNLDENQIQRFLSFITGSCKYLVSNYYGTLTIDSYDESIASKEYGRFDSLRLASVFGKTNGELAYKINDYYDGSGSYKTVIPCETMDEAVEVLKGMFVEKMEKQGLTSGLISVAEKYKIEIPAKYMDDHIQKLVSSKQKEIEGYKKHIEKYEQEILEIKNLNK